MRLPSGRVDAEEEARRRLSRDLHEDHCQRAAALGFELRAIRDHLGGDDPQRSDLDAVADGLRALGEDLRQLSHDLHPAILERQGLAAALGDLCAELGGRQGPAIALDVQGGELPVSPEVALAVYRIAQEGLTNALRHGGARNVSLRSRIDRASVDLSLADDGTGFDPRAARPGGLGLALMQERARLLGGRCRIRSAPGAGTEIEVRIPQRRLSRWLRQRWRWALAAALIFLALGTGLAAALVQAGRADAEARRAAAAIDFLEELFVAADPRRTHGEPPGARELLRHGSERLERELADQPLLRARLLDTLGGIYTSLGLFGEARPMLEEALALRQRLRGDRHPEVATTLTRLGSLAHLSGQGDAAAYFRRAIAVASARGERDPEAIADLSNKLAVALAARGELDQAEVAFRRSLALLEKHFGPDDARVAKALHNLSGIALYRQQPAAAEALIARALSIREATLAEDDPDLAGTREALALLLLQQERPAEARALLESLLRTAERVYGPEHPEVGRVLLNLGKAHAALGADAAAQELFERALAIGEASLAPEQPAFLRTLASLAEHHLSRGRLAEAEPLYRRLLALRENGAAYGQWKIVLGQWDRLRAARSAGGPDTPGGEHASVDGGR